MGEELYQDQDRRRATGHSTATTCCGHLARGQRGCLCDKTATSPIKKKLLFGIVSAATLLALTAGLTAKFFTKKSRAQSSISISPSANIEEDSAKASVTLLRRDLQDEYPTKDHVEVGHVRVRSHSVSTLFGGVGCILRDRVFFFLCPLNVSPHVPLHFSLFKITTEN